MALSTPGADSSLACRHCKSGTLRLRRVTLARWYGGQFILIPNFPGWVCDVCGEREYDAAAMEQVQLILGAETELQPASARRAGGLLPTFTPDVRPTNRRPS